MRDMDHQISAKKSPKIESESLFRFIENYIRTSPITSPERPSHPMNNAPRLTSHAHASASTHSRYLLTRVPIRGRGNHVRMRAGDGSEAKDLPPLPVAGVDADWRAYRAKLVAL